LIRTKGPEKSQKMIDDVTHSDPAPDASPERISRSERLLNAIAPFARVVVVSHVNPDPDSLASMLGIKALVETRQPGKPVLLTLDGMIARAENRAMAELIPVPLVPVDRVTIDRDTAVVMVDTQPYTGRRQSEAAMPQVIIDHHETGGELGDARFTDIRIHMGATSTMVTGYLMEQRVVVPPALATALLYGIESETSGYPREAGSLDDGALIWLYPRADKDLLAQIRNPRLPQSHFATFQTALVNAFIYQDLIVTWCGTVSQPDIIAEIADFFIRFEKVSWVLAVGSFEGWMKLSLRAGILGGQAGIVLHKVVENLERGGNAGGHDRRAGGAIPLSGKPGESTDDLLKAIRGSLLHELNIDEQQGHRILKPCPTIAAP